MQPDPDMRNPNISPVFTHQDNIFKDKFSSRRSNFSIISSGCLRTRRDWSSESGVRAPRLSKEPGTPSQVSPGENDLSEIALQTGRRVEARTGPPCGGWALDAADPPRQDLRGRSCRLLPGR